MNFYQRPDHYATLCHLYWQLRHIRAFDQSRRRLLYRRIKAERLRLVGQGCSSEHVRLFCRMMADPHRPEREAALVRYENAVTEYARLEARVLATSRTACSSGTGRASSGQQISVTE